MSAPQTATFRFAHISDLHLSTNLNSMNPVEAISDKQALVRAIKALRLLCKDYGKATYPSTFRPNVAIRLFRELAANDTLDAVLVTGDVSTTGRSVDLEVSAAAFSGQVPNTWVPGGQIPSLLDSGVPVIAIPGNHDRYEGPVNSPGRGAFEKAMGEHWDFGRGLVCATGNSERLKIAKFRNGKNTLGVLLMDLSLQTWTDAQGILNHVGQGKAYEPVVVAAETVTATLKQEYRERGELLTMIWAVHYPPGYPAISPELDLLDSGFLVTAAARCGVDAVLSGHTHMDNQYELDTQRKGRAPVKVFCCGASSGVSTHGQYSYSIVDVVISGGETSIRAMPHVWSERRAGFYPPI